MTIDQTTIREAAANIHAATQTGSLSQAEALPLLALLATPINMIPTTDLCWAGTNYTDTIARWHVGMAEAATALVELADSYREARRYSQPMPRGPKPWGKCLAEAYAAIAWLAQHPGGAITPERLDALTNDWAVTGLMVSKHCNVHARTENDLAERGPSTGELVIRHIGRALHELAGMFDEVEGDAAPDARAAATQARNLLAGLENVLSQGLEYTAAD